MRGGFWIILHSAPEVSDKAIVIIYSFQRPCAIVSAVFFRPEQVNSAGTVEGLDKIRHVSEPLPDDVCNAGLATKPQLRERGF